MPFLILTLLATLAALSSQPAPEPLPPALLAMAEAERRFSARAAETTPREAFIEFFADEAVSFQPDPGPARERLRLQPPPPPGLPAFQWEPRTGDVSASGDLGYLTGPVRYPQRDGGVRHGCYFSVWKKQADGAFKVILDVGIQPPGEVPFAPGFVRAPARAALRPAETPTTADASLRAADEALGRALATRGAAAAFEQAMHPFGRLHRNGALPLTSREAAVAWLAAHVSAMTSTPVKAESATAGDLGYTWGSVRVTAVDGTVTDGYYVRLWTRGADGRWHLAADITPA